jgi:hypothetical protein
MIPQQTGQMVRAETSLSNFPQIGSDPAPFSVDAMADDAVPRAEQLLAASRVAHRQASRRTVDGANHGQ